MTARTDEFRKQVNELWSQAVTQLEEVKGVLTGRIEKDLVRLRQERERLIKRLGEETFRLTRQGKMYVPDVLRDTITRLERVLDRLLQTQGKSGRGKAARRRVKKVARRRKAGAA